jgi:hypothetical protein
VRFHLALMPMFYAPLAMVPGRDCLLYCSSLVVGDAAQMISLGSVTRIALESCCETWGPYPRLNLLLAKISQFVV